MTILFLIFAIGLFALLFSTKETFDNESEF